MYICLICNYPNNYNIICENCIKLIREIIRNYLIETQELPKEQY